MNERLLTKMANDVKIQTMPIFKQKDGTYTDDKGNVVNVTPIDTTPPPPKEGVPMQALPSGKKQGLGDFDLESLMPWLMAGGLGLVGHSLGSAVMGDPSPDQRRKETMWERVLRALIPIGVGGLAGYGGYRLGNYLKTASVKTAQSREPDLVALRAPGGQWAAFEPSKTNDAINMVRASTKGTEWPEVMESGAQNMVDEEGRIPAWASAVGLGAGLGALGGAGTWGGMQAKSWISGARQGDINEKAQKAMDQAWNDYNSDKARRDSYISDVQGDYDLADGDLLDAKREINNAQGNNERRIAERNLAEARRAERQAKTTLTAARATPQPKKPVMGVTAGTEKYREPAKGRWNAWGGGKWNGGLGRAVGKAGAYATAALAPIYAAYNGYKAYKANQAQKLRERLDAVRHRYSAVTDPTNSVPTAVSAPAQR